MDIGGSGMVIGGLGLVAVVVIVVVLLPLAIVGIVKFFKKKKGDEF
jgi:hypothetical protein